MDEGRGALRSDKEEEEPNENVSFDADEVEVVGVEEVTRFASVVMIK